MYKRWIQVFAAVDIALSCFRLGNATFHLSQKQNNPGNIVQPEMEFGHELRIRLYEQIDGNKYVVLGGIFYILQIMTLSLAIFLMIAISEENGIKQIRRIHIWTGGSSIVVLIYIIYLFRRLYFLPIHRDNQIWYFDIAEILIRFLFVVFVNKYVSFINPGVESFDDIDPEIRQAFQKYVFHDDFNGHSNMF